MGPSESVGILNSCKLNENVLRQNPVTQNINLAVPEFSEMGNQAYSNLSCKVEAWIPQNKSASWAL